MNPMVTSTMKALDLGYDILLEKPIALTMEECVAIQEKAKRLITKSNNRGGTDNISVVLLECESGGVK